LFRTKEIVVGEKPLAFAKSRIVIIVLDPAYQQELLR
jgi:hypothetical protein